MQLLSAALALASMAAMGSEVLVGPSSHVRSVERGVVAALADGISRSPTLHRLVQLLNRSDVIVYIQLVDRLPTTTRGQTLFAADRGNVRYVRIQLKQGLPQDEFLQILGHELQHAAEIAENRQVRCSATLVKLYRRLGAGHSGPSQFETAAALDAGYQVISELRRQRSTRP